MYHPTIIQKRLNNLTDRIRRTDPSFEFKDYSIEEVAARCAQLEKLYDPEADRIARSFTPEEESFIQHEIARCKVDFPYWLTRYAYIKDKRMELVRLNPTQVQKLLLDKIAKAELDAISGATGDGILLQVLKARQLGCSTFSDIAITHRTNFYSHTTAFIAADVDDRVPNLYEMVTRCYDNLPWWMKARSSDVKRDVRRANKYLAFYDQDSVIRFGSSANMQGGNSGETKGSMGTGMTLPMLHATEVALWSNPGQISDALLPSVPLSERTFAIFESTAKGIDNWWYDAWQQSKRGLSRLTPIFIPWYTDPDTYKLPAPLDWNPSEKAVLHAERVRLTSARWVGHTVHLTKDQLYWWERTRAEYEARRELYKFLAEYTSDDDESFQATMGGPFPTELIDNLRSKALNPIYMDLNVTRRVVDRNAG